MEQPTVMKSLEEMTLKELQKELSDKFNFVGSEMFTTKPQVMTVYNALLLKSKEVAPAQTVTAQPKDNERADQKAYESKAARMKALCDAEPKVRFMIPLNGEKMGAVETCQINGYRINILKGVMVSIPQRFAQLLEESYRLTAEAGSDLLADRDPEVKDKLGM